MLKLRNILVSLLAFVVLFMTANDKGLAASSSLKDIPSKYKTEITYLIGKKILTGASVQSFRPKDSITREDAVVMVGHAIGLNGKQQNTSFKDVSSKSSASGYIQSAYKKGLINGYKDKSFKPKARITKADATYLIAKAFSIKQTSNLSFKDVSESNTQFTAINEVVTAGIISVSSGGSFQPNSALSRQDFSVFVARAKNQSFRIPAVQPPNITKKKPVGQYSISAAALNVRKGPSTYYSSIATVKKNQRIDVYEVKSGWAYMQSGKIKGYVSTSYLKLVKVSDTDSNTNLDTPTTGGDVSTPPAEQPGDTQDSSNPSLDQPAKTPVVKPIGQYLVTASSLNVRKGPGATYTKVGLVKKNYKVSVYKIQNGWASISYGTLKGYVSTSYLKAVKSNNKKVIVIDAGHGGKDPGAIGNGLVEKEVNLAVALRVQKLLKTAGIEVVMTRTGDTYPTLSQRNDIAAKSNADAFISIHANVASSKSAGGTETYYNSGGDKVRADESKELAGFIQNRLYKAIDTQNRGVKRQDYQVIKYNPLPAVLVELGFLTNNDDAKKLASSKYRDLAAKSIYQGIVDFYKYIGK
jgi:N-acetylmuramoyl-L-alanine amidase